jgi:hypothetical protein
LIVVVVGAVVAVAVKVSGEPLNASAVAVMVIGPAVPPSVTFTAEIPVVLVATLGAETAAPLATHPTATPATPFPN